MNNEEKRDRMPALEQPVPIIRERDKGKSSGGYKTVSCIQRCI